MPNAYRQETIENWVGDFCSSDGIRPFGAALQDLAAGILVTFLAEACAARDTDPADLEEADVRAAIMGPVARLAVPDSARWEIPALCGAFLAALEAEGRVGGGRALGAFAKALTPAFMDASTGKPKPIVNPGSKIGRNDPCPCGSGKKYKKCCAND